MTIRVALFGSGWIQKMHARAVQDHPEGVLVAATNWREPSLRALADAFGIPRVTTSWYDLVHDEEVDAVVIATPNALHAEQAIACLHAGKHVLVEKPMAMSVAECDAMISAARDAGGSLMVAHCWRFHPAVVAVREAVRRGELGRIVKTHGYGIHQEWGPSGWFTQRALAGGGALIDMGVHAIDTARFLLDDPEPVRVCAAIGTRYKEDYDVDDDGVLLISWSSGVNSVVESGWWQPHLGGLEADTELYGTKGYTRIFSPHEPPEGEDHAPQSMYSAQMAEFLDAIAEGRPPRPSGEDGRVVMQVVEAAYRSARELA
jgi:predicted dehydrogenase